MHCCMYACCWVERLLSLVDGVSDVRARRPTAGDEEERMRREVDADERMVEHWIWRTLRSDVADGVLVR